MRNKKQRSGLELVFVFSHGVSLFLYLHFLALKKDEDQDLPSIAKNFIEVKVPDRNGQGKRTVLIFLSGKGNRLIKASMQNAHLFI